MDNNRMMDLRDLLEIIPGFPRRTPPMRTPENDPGYEERRAEAMRYAEEEVAAANMLGTREGEHLKNRLFQQKMKELMGE